LPILTNAPLLLSPKDTQGVLLHQAETYD